MTETPPNAPSLVLVAPDWSGLDTLGRRAEPPLLWTVGPQSLIAHWLDHAVRQGCSAVTLYCPDRPAAVRSALENGAYWSIKLDLRPTLPSADVKAQAIHHLPGQSAPAPLPTDGASLLRWWLDLNRHWLSSRDPALVHIDTLREPGGWIGPRVLLAPGTQLRPPYWIGAGTFVEPGCILGPGALIGPGSVISTDVRIENALVQGGTFVGAHLDLDNKILLGATLLDPDKAARADLTDDFIASAMRRPALRTPPVERLIALLLWLPANLLALGAGPATESEIQLPGGRQLTLATRAKGKLLARRSAWLRHVINGRIRLIGILPREEFGTQLPEETRTLLAHTTPGVFSLADVHGSHSPAEPDELAHALYQAALPETDRTVRSSLASLCLTQPAS